MTDVDAVVVGAGNAGLTAAATLQRAGVRTLLVERHTIPGGCATSFRRGRFEFEVALHQLSGIGRESQEAPLRGMLDGRAAARPSAALAPGDPGSHVFGTGIGALDRHHRGVVAQVTADMVEEVLA
ncbi:FAD-dependent oxidoreductase [Streptomyces sp. NPDC006458]|uniref:FAD-dependent oxidoreductase n=1 Tax=Streptomyces sp. NPDC006458 TaxID=3154302 RepID=UPI0033B8C78E